LGEQIGRGRTSVVYAYGDDRVIKLYPKGEPRANIDYEAEVAALVHRLEIPSLACHGVVEVDGQAGVVFDRLHGPSLNEIAEKDILHLPAVCRVLADLQVALHAGRRPELPDVRERAVELLDTGTLKQLSPTERDWLTEHLRGLPDGEAILHLDYHVQNAFRHGDGHVIIDWYSARRGHPAADVAMSVVMMREVELFPGTPPLKLLLYQAARRVISHFYLRRYLQVTAVTKAEVEAWMTCARVLRLGELDVPSERKRFLRRIRAAARAGRP
jgi:Ser/Thr protein kinase RdoA (MazF antagonist)